MGVINCWVCVPINHLYITGHEGVLLFESRFWDCWVKAADVNILWGGSIVAGDTLQISVTGISERWQGEREQTCSYFPKSSPPLWDSFIQSSSPLFSTIVSYVLEGLDFLEFDLPAFLGLELHQNLASQLHALEEAEVPVSSLESTEE